MTAKVTSGLSGDGGIQSGAQDYTGRINPGITNYYLDDT